jgi:ferredoxin
VFSNPETEEQKEALYCGACHVDLTPLLKAINRKKEEERKAKEAQEAVPVEVIQTEEAL